MSETSTPSEDRSTAEQTLYRLWGEIRDLRSAEYLLQWDQETMMPAQGVEGHSRVAATLAGLKHAKVTAPELLDALDGCAEVAQEGSLLASQVRCARLDVDRAVKVPEALVRELAQAASQGIAAWQEARAQADFSLFEKPLRRLVELRRQEAAAIDSDAAAYDVLIQGFEPDSSEAELAPLFASLRRELGPLVQAVQESGLEVDEGVAEGSFPLAAQEDFGRFLSVAIGFDYGRGRLDGSTHPFCIGIDADDVRLTWRAQEDDFRSAVFGILHESGHGLYEQGLAGQYPGTPVGDAVSLGIHESQSRLWENHVGRSRGFWRWALPHFRERFPDHFTTGNDEAHLDRLWPALHTVVPSLIRVEADEATYNLHIAIRFELERALFSGQVGVTELPGAWDDLYQELLGIRADNAADGVLQDIHWSMGMFGYFPTYTLGTMAAAQLFAAAERELGDLEAAFAEGSFAPLLAWLRREVHHHGGRYPASELIERATGRPLSSDDLLAYLRQTVADAYPGIGL